jgi:long-chain acyl-CoA synthetase
VSAIARGLIALGVRPGERVSILAGTRAEWTLVDLGSLCAGAVVAPIYDSDSPEECRYILEHAGSRLVFCEDAEQLAKIEQVRDRCPQLEHLVTFDGSGPNTIPLGELRSRGSGLDASELDRFAAAVRPEDMATIVYTSGTTGPPKGCITTHANLMRTARMYERQIDLGPGSVVFMFLPLAHSLARVTQTVVLDVGGTIAYWGGDPTKIAEEIAVCAPTHFPAVPRIYEKIHTAIVDAVEEKVPYVGGALLRWALAQGRKARAAERAGRRLNPIDATQYDVADRLVLRNVRRAFGPRLVMALVGAAPIAPELVEFFDACGVLLCEGYGLTESCSSGTLNPAAEPRAGTIGLPLPEAEVKVAPDGELLLRGPHVFSGYYRDEAATAEAIDEDGWLHTGDLGSRTDNGYVRITGRKKDLIITSSGKNITPTNIESALRDTRWISEAVVYGDQRPYLVCMLTLDRDEAPKLADHLGIAPNAAEMALDEGVREAVMHDVDEVNKRFARIEQVKRIGILDHDFTQAAGELTPTLKVKRNVVYGKYADFLNDLYEDHESHVHN